MWEEEDLGNLLPEDVVFCSSSTDHRHGQIISDWGQPFAQAKKGFHASEKDLMNRRMAEIGSDELQGEFQSWREKIAETFENSWRLYC